MMDGLKDVDFARGTRDYMNAVDIINAAPIDADVARFSFRFRRFLRRPGGWVALARGEKDRESAVALEVDGRGFAMREQQGASLRKVGELESGITPDMVDVDHNFGHCQLLSERDFWAQLIDLTRFYGQRRFGIERWAVLRLSGTGTCLKPLTTDPATIWIDLQTVRAETYGLRYWVEGSDIREGRLVCAPLLDEGVDG